MSMKRTVLVVAMLLSMSVYGAQKGGDGQDTVVLALRAAMGTVHDGNSRLDSNSDGEGEKEVSAILAAATAALPNAVDGRKKVKKSRTARALTLGAVVVAAGTESLENEESDASASVRVKRKSNVQSPLYTAQAGVQNAQVDAAALAELQTIIAANRSPEVVHNRTVGSPTGDPADQVRQNQHEDLCSVDVLQRMGISKEVIETAQDIYAAVSSGVSVVGSAVVKGLYGMGWLLDNLVDGPNKED